MESSCAAVVMWTVLPLMVVLSAGTTGLTTSGTNAGYASPPCKQYNGTMVDCRARNITALPTGLPLTSTAIDLSLNTIHELSEWDFSTLLLLKRLNLSRNVIRTIPNNTFRNLISLQILDLSWNMIDHLGKDAFSGLVGLVRLDLSANCIVSVPGTVFRDQGKLLDLSLAWNNISEMPSDAMVHLKSVRSLDLSLNSLGRQVFRLGDGLESMTSLQRLLLAGMNIEYLPESSFTVLQSLTELEFLDLSLNSLFKIDNGTFHPLQNLTWLSLKNTYYDPRSPLPSGILELDLAGVLPDVVPDGTLTVDVVRRLSRYSPNIESISFAKTKMARIQDFALGFMKALRRLDLSKNALDSSSLSNKSFEGLSHLQELDLSNNRFANVPTEALSAFRLIQTLRSLNLAHNGLFHLAADVFASVPFLTSLNLEGNDIYRFDNSLDSFQNLARLNLANNDFFRFPPIGWESPLPDLQVLDISHNEGGEYVTDTFTLGNLAPNLEELYSSNIKDYFDLVLLDNCSSLVTLDVSQNGIGDESFYGTGGFGTTWASLTLPRLETLNFDGNQISFLAENVFDGTPKLRSINVSQNALKTVDMKTFASLSKLEVLDLSSNSLVNISALDPYLPSLRSVALSNNKISFVDVNLLDASRQPNLQVLDLSHNTYSCTCDVEDFHNWLLQDTRVFLRSASDYRCNSPEELEGELVVELELDFCVSYLGVYLGVSFTLGFILILGIVIFCVRYHWHLRYKLFLMFRRGQIEREIGDNLEDGVDNPGLDNNNLGIRFDAFVSYNDHDSDWVFQQLIPHLEDHQKDDVLFRLCVSDRDLPAGDSKVDVIVEAIQCSRKTILVLTDHFLESEWCYYEMQMAHLRLFNEGRDVLILILLGEICDHKMTMLLRQTLCRKNYLKWPTDKLGQHLFWDRLREELKVSPAVDRRLDV